MADILDNVKWTTTRFDMSVCVVTLYWVEGQDDFSLFCKALCVPMDYRTEADLPNKSIKSSQKGVLAPN